MTNLTAREYSQKVINELNRQSFSKFYDMVEAYTGHPSDGLIEVTTDLIQIGWEKNIPVEETAVAIYSAAFMAYHEVFTSMIKH